MYQLPWTKILTNAGLGAFFFGLFTYLTEMFNTHPKFLKMGAFLWTAPLFFFFIIYITWSKGKEVMLAFTKHALLGSVVSILIFSVTICISNWDISTVVAANIVILLLLVSSYFCYSVYNII